MGSIYNSMLCFAAETNTILHRAHSKSIPCCQSSLPYIPPPLALSSSSLSRPYFQFPPSLRPSGPAFTPFHSLSPLFYRNNCCNAKNMTGSAKVDDPVTLGGLIEGVYVMFWQLIVFKERQQHLSPMMVRVCPASELHTTAQGFAILIFVFAPPNYIPLHNYPIAEPPCDTNLAFYLPTPFSSLCSLTLIFSRLYSRA